MTFGTIFKEIRWVFSPPKQGYVVYWNLLIPIPMAFGMLSLRYLLSKFCFARLGVYLGVKQTKRPTPNPILEDMYKKFKEMPRPQIVGLAKQLDMTERQVEQWLRDRKRLEKPSKLFKFCESCWRFTYYTCLFVYGLAVLWNKPWLWDIQECWTGYPNLAMTWDIWWYYTISLSFYWSLFIGQFFLDVKRKDFYQMLIHHTATILLMCFSWLAGVYKVGTLVLVLHDCGDIPLEVGKISKYSNHDTVCTVIFCIFTVVWIVTRLGVFPFWIIKHTLFESPEFVAYYVFNGLLILLLVLHCYWTYLILKIAISAVGAGQVEGDVRSSSDDEST